MFIKSAYKKNLKYHVTLTTDTDDCLKFTFAIKQTFFYNVICQYNGMVQVTNHMNKITFHMCMRRLK